MTTHADRRQRFLAGLPEGSIAIFPAAPTAVRSADVEHPYRASNDLLYLTDYPEAEAVCVLDREAEAPFQLFVLPRDPERETWNGRRFGSEGAVERFGADEAHEIATLGEKLAPRLAERRQLFYELGRDAGFDDRILRLLRGAQVAQRRSGAPSISLHSPSDTLHEMRLRKDAGEIERMRRAAAVSATAHAEALAATRPGVLESEVEAALGFAFRRLGGSGPAYPSIVASGANATILHYIDNDQAMRDGDLLLIDAGAEVEHYCSDVTRSFPVGGRFSAEQRAVYDVVLAAQQAAIDKVAPGNRFDDVHEAALRVLVDGLRELGVIEDESTDEAIEKKSYTPFYMHKTSHWLGMDVHDVGRYRVGGESRPLEAGMVLTVEPGLYFAEGGPSERFAGIGVRIEDDLLVSADGHENLTAAIPKAPEDLER